MREMKDSGIPWIGEIPKVWSCDRIKYHFYVELGKMVDSSVKDEELLSNYLCAANIKWSGVNDKVRRRMYFSSNEKKQYELHDNDVLIMEGGATAGTSCVYHNEFTPCYIQNSVMRCKPINKDNYNKFLFYWLFIVYHVEYVNAVCNEATFKHFTKDKVQNTPFLTIPFEEQRQITAYLDAKCAEIDSLCTDIRAEIETLEEYKRSVITEAVTKGLDPNVETKDSGIPWIGEIPKDWDVIRIADLFEERNEPGEDQLPMLTVSINTGVSDRELADEEKDRVFIRSEDKTKYKRVYPGDLTYNMMRAWQGAMGAVRVKGMVSPAYIVAKPKDNVKVESRYVEALLRSPAGIDEMRRYSYGVRDFRLRLYWPLFRIIKLCLPNWDTQKQIAAFIDMKSAEVDSIISQKYKQLETLDAYKKSLIYEYVTGKKEVPAD